MNCQDRACFLTDLALGEIDAREGAALLAHVRECASCAASLREIQEVAGQLAGDLQAEPFSQLTQQQWSELRRKAQWRPVTKIGIGLGIAASGLFALGLYWYATHTCPPAASIVTEGNPVESNEAESKGILFHTEMVKVSPPHEMLDSKEEIQIAPIPNDPNLSPEQVEALTQKLELATHEGVVGDKLQGEPNFLLSEETPAEEGIGAGSGMGKAIYGRRHLATHGGRAVMQEKNTEPDAGRWNAEVDQEDYRGLPENPFVAVESNPLSTFSIDTDTASYANARRFLNEGNLPPREAIRVEEFINYFSYDYPSPTAEHPVGVSPELSRCPWAADHLLLRVALQARKVATEKRPPCNLVFLLDVSGSMEPANKLPLLKSGMRALVNGLQSRDRVGIVTYAGEAALALPSTSCENKKRILDAIEGLKADGSTNGGAGIRMAYEMARGNFIKEGVNRVLIGTDGDFNVGVTDQNELMTLIQSEAKSGVFLSVLGFGMGNLKDATLEGLADKGNGSYAYIDNYQEARKTLLEQASSTLVTVAKDVKLQIEFNPARISAYRLIGYENRALAAKDFNDDRKDAGEMGAGQSVTAFYELVPTKPADGFAEVDPLRYQRPAETIFETNQAAPSREFANIKLRYKMPEGEASRLLERAIETEPVAFAKASPDFRFAASVAAFGLILRDSSKRGSATIADIIPWAESAQGKDADGYRGEFLHLVRAAQRIQEKR